MAWFTYYVLSVRGNNWSLRYHCATDLAKLSRLPMLLSALHFLCVCMSVNLQWLADAQLLVCRLPIVTCLICRSSVFLWLVLTSWSRTYRFRLQLVIHSVLASRILFRLRSSNDQAHYRPSILFSESIHYLEPSKSTTMAGSEVWGQADLLTWQTRIYELHFHHIVFTYT
jgi:hypothetical protein